MCGLGGFAAYLPEWAQRRRRLPPLVEPLFPGYVFFQSDGQPDWELRARSAPNVMYVLGGADGPQAVPESLVDDIRRRCELRTLQPFASGDRVRIMRGPFRDLDVVFDAELPRGERTRVFVLILGRLVPVSVETEVLRRAL